MQARTAFITTNMSVKEGEAIVVLQTLIWLSNQQVYNVIIELDSKLVVDQIHSNEEDISECGMINQIKDIMKSSPSTIVQYSRRESNLVAHSLVRNSILFAYENIYLHIPHCIKNIVLMERI